MRVGNRNKFFYYAAPVAILAAGIFVLATDYWEWFGDPKYVEKGLKAFQRGELVEAIRDFSKAQQRCETNILARLMLGAAYHEYGWQDEALSEYDTVLRLARENGTRAAHSSARVWVSRGKYDEATRFFDLALTFDPTAADIWFESGQVRLLAGDPTSAMKRLAEAVRLKPNEPLFRQEAEKLAKSLQGAGQQPGGVR